MAKAPDLTGNVYGNLVVLSKSARPKIGKNGKEHSVWICHCNRCGRDEEIVVYKLPTTPARAKRAGIRYSCTICSRGPCAICGSEILTDTYKGVCSEACHLERKRAQSRESKRRTYDSEANRLQYKKKIERIHSDPELLEEHRKKERDRARRRRSDPVERERLLASGRERYAKNRDEILNRRKERLASMSTEEHLIFSAHAREYRRQYWALNSDWISEKRRARWNSLTEEEKQQHRDKFNARAREVKSEREAAKALQELFSVGAELSRLKDSDDD